MANHYTEMSIVLPHPPGMSPEEANIKVKAWLEQTSEDMDSDPDDDEDEDGYYEKYGGLRVQADTQVENGVTRRLVWIYHDESANVEAAATLIQAYLDHLDFPHNAGVFFSWASYCSKPRVNEASGGAAVVTRSEIRWTHSNDLARSAQADGITLLT